MSKTLKFLLVSVVPVMCVGVAGYLVTHDKGGWGWFLVATVMTNAFVVKMGMEDERRDF